MDGRMNCHLTAENAAFTKIRQLEKRVDETDKELADVEQQVLANTNAFNEHVAQTSEKVETKALSATSVTANTANITNAEAGNLNANGITATTITAETANVDNLENVNVLHGKTVDVDKTIATIGQFTETHTTTANNATTNTDTLNVATEANLTGQVNIDGNLTFTKDNGLSKLQGEYLEVDAANVVLNNKTKGGYALYAPGVDGSALFGGSVSVQDTLTAKNLIVVGDVLMSGLKLDAKTELTNPTFKGIKGTNELTTTALVIDNEGKLVSKKISSEVEGSVASSLVAQREKRTHTLLDEWKFNEANPIFKIPVSSTAQFVFPDDVQITPGILLTNENGNQKVINELGVASTDEVIFSVAHKNFVYIIHPTMENGTTYKCVVIPINTETMEVSPSFDITQYLGPVSSGDIGESLVDVLYSRIIVQPLAYGMVLPDDVPTIGFIGTNNYLDLSTMEIKTRDTAFSANWCVLSKSGNWIELPGSIVDNNFYCTNGRYSSVEDAALGVPASDYIVNPETDQIEKQLYYVDAPVFGMHNENNLVYLDGGAVKEVAFADISFSNYGSIFGTVDKDGNPVSFSSTVIYSGEAYRTNLFLYYGYYPREYFASTTVSYVDTIIIDKNKVEINGSTFVDGVWYDKVVSSTNALIDFITKQKDKKRYKVLFLGNNIELNTSDTSQVPTSGYSENDIYGTFDIYHINDINGLHSLKLDGTPGTATRMNKLLDACHFHGFDTTADILFCSNTSNLGADWVVKYLHINDCYISFKTNGNAVPQDKFYLGISDSNNVIYQTVNIPTALFTTSAGNKEVDVTLSKCYNVVFNGKQTSSSTAESYYYYYSQILFDRCDRCEVVANVPGNVISSQYGPGYNFTYDTGAGSGSEFVLPTVKNK